MHDRLLICNNSISLFLQNINNNLISIPFTLENDSNKPYTIKEEYCSSQDTVAVGVLDKAQLNPGEQIEMYIIRDKLWLQQQERLQTRPRVTNQK